MRTIRAKFECTHVLPAVEGYPSRAFLTPVIYNEDGSFPNEENKSFSEATPAGHLEIYISEGVPASKFFKAGREYYLDFTKIPLAEVKSLKEESGEN